MAKKKTVEAVSAPVILDEVAEFTPEQFDYLAACADVTPVPVDTVAEALGLADRLDAALTGRGIEEMPVVHPLLVEWLSDADAALELVRKGDVIQPSELAGLVRRARALLG